MDPGALNRKPSMEKEEGVKRGREEARAEKTKRSDNQEKEFKKKQRNTQAMIAHNIPSAHLPVNQQRKS
ncbi:hypothetical protein SDJN03_28455, partial [Cucurbita argyrosperma subsp. sororia]